MSGVRQSVVVKPEAQPSCMQKPLDGQFRRRMATGDALHFLARKFG
jgi:hypothetical protein